MSSTHRSVPYCIIVCPHNFCLSRMLCGYKYNLVVSLFMHVFSQCKSLFRCLEVLFPMLLFFARVKILAENHGLIIVHGFDRISFHPRNTSLEAAMEPKFAPFPSPWDTISDATIFLPGSKFYDSGRKPWTIGHSFDRTSALAWRCYGLKVLRSWNLNHSSMSSDDILFWWTKSE